MPRTVGAWARSVLPVGVSVALLWAVWHIVDADQLLARGLSWPWVLGAAALGPVQVWLAGMRWARVCRALDVPMETRQAVAEVGLSTALNQVLPAGIAGDAIRAWRQRAHGVGVVAETVVVDRAIGLAMLLVFAALGAWLVPGAFVVVGGVVVVCVGLACTPPGAGFRRVLHVDGAAQIGLSMCLTGSFVAGFMMSAWAVQVPLGPWVWVVPLLLLAMAVPVSFGGWGPREMSAVVVWPLIGGTSEEGVAVSVVYGISVLVGAVPGAVLWGWRGR